MTWFTRTIASWYRRALGVLWDDATYLWDDPAAFWDEGSDNDWYSENGQNWYTKN